MRFAINVDAAERSGLRLSSRLLGLAKVDTGRSCSIASAPGSAASRSARKLTTTALTTSGVTLIAACTVFATYDYINLRSRLVRDVTMLADIVGTNSTAALTFKDAAAAAETLRATAVNEHILDARLFTRDGTLLATYMRPGLVEPRRAGRRRAAGRRSGRRVRGGPPARRPADFAQPRDHRQHRGGVRHDRSLDPARALRGHRRGHAVRGLLDCARPVAHDGAADLRPDRAADRGDASRARRRPLRRPRRRRATTTKSAS